MKREWIGTGTPWDDKVYFCPAFFSGALSADQEVAIMGHEFSHFPGTKHFPGPGTDDDKNWSKPSKDISASLKLAPLYEQAFEIGKDADSVERMFLNWIKLSLTD